MLGSELEVLLTFRVQPAEHVTAGPLRADDIGQDSEARCREHGSTQSNRTRACGSGHLSIVTDVA
jgi:hypothetical protein